MRRKSVDMDIDYMLEFVYIFRSDQLGQEAACIEDGAPGDLLKLNLTNDLILISEVGSDTAQLGV